MRRPSLSRLVAAEGMKLATLPAVWSVLAATWAATILVAVLLAQPALTPDGLDLALQPIGYLQAGFLILGVIAVTSEYPGPIRTTLTVTTRRGRVLLAKTAAAAGFALIGAVIALALSAGTVSIVLGKATPFGSRTLASGIAYLAFTALIAYAIGLLLRRAIPAVALVLGYYLIAGPLIRSGTHASIWLPDTAGYALWNPHNSPPGLTAPLGWAVVAAWTIALLALSGVLFRHRDA